MNKKTYCTPAITVAQGVLQPVLAAVSGQQVEDQSLSTASESTRTTINLNGYKAWTSEENKDQDNDFNF